MRKICVVTGSRADYGLLRCLLEILRRDNRFILQLVATGAHFSSRHGNTWREITKDGFRIDRRVRLNIAGDSGQSVARTTGLALIRLSRAFQALKPQAVLLLGDRYEILAAAEAAMFCRIPIIHLHGGEATEGLVDEAIRHAITKMSHLHFVSTKEYRRRVIQMGEDPKKVFVVGALGLDSVRKLRVLSREQVQKKLGISFSQRNFLITFHPPTLSPGAGRTQLKELLSALASLRQTTLIFTFPNSDMESLALSRLIRSFVRRHPSARVFHSLGQLTYLSCLQHVDAVVGNSSSGIIEAPSLRCPTINIGDRQQGRIRGNTVLDCVPRREAIIKALHKAVSPEFRRKVASSKNPYDQGGAAEKIVQNLDRFRWEVLLKKKFYNLE